MRPLGMVVDRHFVHDAMLQPRDLLIDVANFAAVVASLVLVAVLVFR